jgi:hypothetical protein
MEYDFQFWEFHHPNSQLTISFFFQRGRYTTNQTCIALVNPIVNQVLSQPSYRERGPHLVVMLWYCVHHWWKTEDSIPCGTRHWPCYLMD